MLELIAFALIAPVLLALFAGVFVLLTLLKLVLRLVLLPLLLLKFVVLGVLFTIVGPVLFVVGLIVTCILAVAVMAPLLPFLAVAFLVWVLVRRDRSTALVRAS